MSSLYEFTSEFMLLSALAASDEDEQAFLDTLEGLKGELSAKAGGYVHVINQLAMAAAECSKVMNACKAK